MNPSHHRGSLVERASGDNAGAVTEDDTTEVEFAYWKTGGGVAVIAAATTSNIALPLLMQQLRHSATRQQFSDGPSAKKKREIVG